jgi:hypothetical protein
MRLAAFGETFLFLLGCIALSAICGCSPAELALFDEYKGHLTKYPGSCACTDNCQITGGPMNPNFGCKTLASAPTVTLSDGKTYPVKCLCICSGTLSQTCTWGPTLKMLDDPSLPD